MEHLSNDHEVHPISKRIAISHSMKWGILFQFIGKSMENEKTAWSEFPNGGKAIVEQILASEKINKSNRAGLWESQSGIQVGKLTIWIRLFEIEKLKHSSPGLSVPPK